MPARAREPYEFCDEFPFDALEFDELASFEEDVPLCEEELPFPESLEEESPEPFEDVPDELEVPPSLEESLEFELPVEEVSPDDAFESPFELEVEEEDEEESLDDFDCED